MRRIVIAKMLGLTLCGLYLAIGLTQPIGDEQEANGAGCHDLLPITASTDPIHP